jgi:hypothetical protein
VKRKNKTRRRKGGEEDAGEDVPFARETTGRRCRNRGNAASKAASKAGFSQLL